MSNKSNLTVATMGIDIGKNSFHIVGLDRRGAIVLRQKWSRGQVEARLVNMPRCLIGMEACVGAHDLSRKLQSHGHDARLMPAKYVRPYSKGQKNDFRDTEAIAEAVGRPTMKFVATRSDVLSPRMMRIIEDLAGDWRCLDERIEGLSTEIEAVAHQDPACERLMTVPGIGPIISSAMVAAIGNGAVFAKGRDFGAWLGLVPKQISTGDRTILGAISKRGNRYLRVLFVQAAWVVLVKIKDWDRYGLKAWIDAAKKRLHHNVLAIALANKLARIAWAVLNKERNFECARTRATSPRPA